MLGGVRVAIGGLLMLIVVSIGQPPEGTEAIAAGAGCCKICTKGCACGDSCIACDKVCRKGPGCACNAK
jgi:hypothetical protein